MSTSRQQHSQKLLETAIHAIYWGILFGIPLIIMQSTGGSIFNKQTFTRFFIVPISLCLIFYLNYFLFIPRLLFKERHKEFFLVNLLTIFAIAIGLRLWFDFIIGLMPPEKHMMHTKFSYLFVILRDVTSLVFSAGLSVAIKISKKWHESEAARREAIKSQTEAELKNLRSQLNPHFLLNTLNNIYALIAFDADKAQQAVQELSKLLRYVLYENQETTVPLHKEVNFISNYVELMKIRMPAHVEVKTEFDIRPGSATPIVPLIFISLIENAFKHGISPTQKSFIHIRLAETDDEIVCHISNSNYPKTESDRSGSGIGLEQVKNRLELAYPGQYTWEQTLCDEGRTYSSTIRIRLH